MKSLKDQLLEKFSATQDLSIKNISAELEAKKHGLIPSEHKLRIKIDNKSRGGKTVTLVDQLPPNREYFENILKELKKICGTGGSLKDFVIEIQGNHSDKVKTYLTAKGFRF